MYKNAEIGRFPLSLSETYLIRRDTILAHHVRRMFILDMVLR
jgi:hypothetical protein